VSMLVNERFTSNSTSDLRPEALDAFIKRSVESASYLEPDPERAQPPGEDCGRGVTEEQLDQDDPAWSTRTADDRSNFAEAIENAIRDLHEDDVISSAAYSSDGRAEAVRVMSNGFCGETSGAWFAVGGEMTLQEGEKRPESSAYFAARHHADLPSIDHIAAEVVRRTRERIGAGPIDSGTYPMILENRVAPRLLGVLGSAMSGGALHQGRSFLVGKLGQRIGSDLLNIVDDPTISRGLGSRPWDGDALRSRRRVIIEKGVLQSYNIDTYHARKMGVQATSGGRSNWILPTGDQSWAEIAKPWPKASLVTGFLGGNANGTTGDFSFGIRGVLIENGVPTQSLAEMNVSGNAAEVFNRLVALGNDPWQYSSCASPAMIFEDVSFSGN
ncbi:MAG: TldD/PmbA family protein, partial [Rhodobacterales bacterium]|nr:TldD/PmbA family protein [Rhodobacterales bacterium]